MQTMSLFRFFIAAVLGLALAACGGGGGGGGTADADQVANPATDAPVAPDGSTNGDSASTADAIEKYLGTFVSTACEKMTDVLNASTGDPLFEKRTIAVETKLAANRAQVKYVHEFFTNDACTGDSALLTIEGSSNTLTIDGTTGVSQGTADKVTLAEGNKLPGISGANITINGVRYINGYSQPKDTKTLMLLSGQDLFVGSATASVDAQGYPTALAASSSYKKQ
jgi:hypothetical protein